MSIYKIGTQPSYVPKAATIEEQHESGYLKQNVEIAKAMLRLWEKGHKSNTGPFVRIPVWEVAVAAGVDPAKRSQVEKAAVCAHCFIEYGRATPQANGKRAPGVRRVIAISEKGIRKYFEEVKEYRDRRRSTRRAG